MKLSDLKTICELLLKHYPDAEINDQPGTLILADNILGEDPLDKNMTKEDRQVLLNLGAERNKRDFGWFVDLEKATREFWEARSCRVSRGEMAGSCPFCGSKNLDFGEDDLGQGTHMVFCKKCGASGPEAKDKNDAVIKWDKRVLVWNKDTK